MKIISIIMYCFVISLWSEVLGMEQRNQEMNNPTASCVEFKTKRLNESFLNKNKILMTQVSELTYTVSDSQFDNIFPPCHFSQSKNLINNSVGLIQNKYFDNDKFLTATGTATIIKNTINEIILITAKHVVAKEGEITFNLGCSSLMPGDNRICNLAKYKECGRKVFLHESEDIAYVKLELDIPIIDREKLLEYLMEISYDPVSTEEEVKIYHYPFGIETQKINEGKIFVGNNNHTMPTLGGSSGSPIIFHNKIIGIHCAGGDDSSLERANFRDKQFCFADNNYYVRMSNISPDCLINFINS